jgi:hypothetical protein
MSKKTYNYVCALITAASTAAVASVSYFCEPTTAATVNGIITAVTGLAITIMEKFIKDE